MYEPAVLGGGGGPAGPGQPTAQQQYMFGTDYGAYNNTTTDSYGPGGTGFDYYDEEGEEEMPTERELAEDAQWKLIQKNTFTRWANEHLKLINKNIADLEFDLSDGLRLIGLVEVLSGKKFPKFNRRPNFRTQKLENVTMCLKFLEEDEGIKIVNIGKSVEIVFLLLVVHCRFVNSSRKPFNLRYCPAGRVYVKCSSDSDTLVFGF
jgi:hypothetical protein